MNKEEFKAWAKRHSLTIEQAAKVLGVSRSNAFRYAKGEIPVTKPVAYGAEVIDLLPEEKSRIVIQKRLA